MPTTTLTPQELRIMKVVWRLKRATVRDVHEALREERDVAYTTVMTMLRILEGKGYLRKSLQERAHVYTPVKPREQVLGVLVRDFLERVFDGVPQGLLLHLAKHNRLTPTQRRKVMQLLEEADQ